MIRVTLEDIGRFIAVIGYIPKNQVSQAVAVCRAAQLVMDAARRYFGAMHEKSCQCDPCVFLATLDNAEQGK